MAEWLSSCPVSPGDDSKFIMAQVFTIIYALWLNGKGFFA